MAVVKQLIYLLDTSGSILSGNKLASMNEAMRTICELVKEVESTDVKLEVSVFTFNHVRGKDSALTPIFESMSTEKAADCWSDIQPGSIMGGTPLGQALIELAEKLNLVSQQNEDIGDKTAAPAIVILSDGIPTVYDEEVGSNIAQSLEDFKKDIATAEATSIEFGRALRASIALEVEEGSEAEELLFAIAHGSRSIKKEDLCFHSSDNIDSLKEVIYSATVGTLS